VTGDDDVDAGELAVMRELAGKCFCGWQLPLSVIAYPRHAPGEHAAEIPGAMVGLVCPMCGRGHGFYTSLAETPQ
jgi:hypothetical protein